MPENRESAHQAGEKEHQSIHRYNQKIQSALRGLEAAATDPNDDDATAAMESELVEDSNRDYLHWRRKEDLNDRFVHPDDYEAIRQFVRYRDSEDVAQATLLNDIRVLKMAAARGREAVGKPVIDFEAERRHNDPAIPPEEQWRLNDLDELLWALSHEYDMEEGGIYNYRKILRNFWRYHGKEWFRAVDASNNADYDYDADDMITWDEQKAIVDGAETPRDKALVALLFDSRQRIGGLGTLRVKDIDLRDKHGYLNLNDEAIGLKRADGKVPITWSCAYVAQALENHPLKGEAGYQDSAFFTPSRASSGDTGEFMSYPALRQRYVRALENAGLKDKYGDSNPHKLRFHNARHTGLSQLVQQGEGEGRIRQLFAKWHPDSTQFETYQNVKDEDMAESFLQDKGILDEEDIDEPETFDACPWPSCETTIPPGKWEFCPGCSRALSQDAVAKIDGVEEEITDSYKQAEPDSDTIDKVEQLEELLQDDELKDLLMQRMAEQEAE